MEIRALTPAEQKFRTIRRCVKNGCEVSANYRAVSAHRRGGC